MVFTKKETLLSFSIPGESRDFTVSLEGKCFSTGLVFVAAIVTAPPALHSPPRKAVLQSDCKVVIKGR